MSSPAAVAANDTLSLLLFTLRSEKLLALNLLKVSEIIPCPPLTRLPEAHPHVKGVATLRGAALSVIDLSRALGEPALQNPDGGCLIVTEVSRSKQGLQVQAVNRIVQCRTSDILAPSFGTRGRSYVTGTAQVDGQLVQILDIEKIIHGITPAPIEPDVSGLDIEEVQLLSETRALVVDDSQVALHQSANTLKQLGVAYHAVRGAREAMERLEALRGTPDQINVVVSDIEMPEMDGYALARTLRNDPRYSGLYVLLHTSLDSTMNMEKAKAAGANDILTKFSPPELAKCLVRAAKAIHGR
ncbi:chemotaxis protein [Stutzerimonas tarimensis]|uniref:Chemotaxis protein n=1 Tax=Stutzerimonas tarimensis TaxID=1507735 RepID=A0ABV7T4K5_9GAMM